MNGLADLLHSRLQDLAGRMSGPLNFRLVIMPLVVMALAIRAGLRDAREGQPAFLWAILTKRGMRPQLLRSALKDLRRVFIVAAVMDTVYQLMILHAFYIAELLLVAVACAVVPYILVRGPVTRLARVYRKWRAAAGRKNRPAP